MYRRHKEDLSSYRRLDGSKLADERPISVTELFRLTNFADKMLILVGALFAALEGAGPALMALVFGGMTNTLVDTVKFGFADSSEVDQAVTISPTVPPTTTPANQTANEIQLPTPVEFEAMMSKFAIYFVMLGVIVYLSSLIQITCWQTACERQVHRIRLAFFRSVLRQELSWFDRNRAGDLANKFADDIERIRDGTGEQFSAIVKYSSSFISGFLVGFLASWRLTLVILAATPLLAAFSAYLGRMLASSTKREQEKYAEAGALAEEVLTSIRTVFSLNGQRSEIARYSEKLQRGKKMAESKYLRLSATLGASMFVLYASYGLALYVAGQLLADDQVTAGKATTVIMAVMMGANALGNIIPPLQIVAMAMSSASLVYAIIEHLPRIDALSDRGLKLSKVTANIKFENVTFSYPTRPEAGPVLRGLNLELSQGQTVAICGKTGAGKSTLMSLLLRFYDPDSGAIYLDNCNLAELNVAWLRSLAGVVEQEPALFDCSIFENICLGASRDLDKTPERVIEAAKRANVHEFISNLPDGYNTRCGERGVQMSGGQKQRIAIARALLCDPKLLLLDEATSALDSESEFMVRSALARARQGRTTIVIAHRLSTIRDADLICVIDEGRLVEMGRHDQLMADKGHYHSLVTSQIFADSAQSEGSATESGGDGTGNGRNGNGRHAPSDLDSDGSSSVGGRQQQVINAEGALNSQLLSTGSAMVASGSHKSGSTNGQSSEPPPLYETIHKPLKSLAEFRSVGEQLLAPVAPPTRADLMRLIRPDIVMVSLGVLANVLAGALLPTFALFYAQIFDTFTKTGDELVEAATFWALMFVALALANLLVMFFRVHLMACAFESVLARVRADCFGAILRQHVGWFDAETNSAQRLTIRLASDVPQIKSILNARLSSLISGLATILASLLIAFYLGWQLALLLTVALPVLLYVGYLQMRIQRGDKQLHLRRLEDASRLATETISHVRLVQALNQERHFFDRFARELAGPLASSLRSARRFGLVYGLTQSTIFFVYGASFRWGAYLIARQVLDPITVYRVFFSIAFTAVAVGQWGGIGGDMTQANQAIGLILRLLSNRPAIDNLSRGGIKPPLKGAITLQDVHFRYPTRPEVPVLRGINIHLEPGQTLALVGPSGNGKTTIANLLLRFYDPDRGVVRIDNYDIRCINLAHLRLNVGLVAQEPTLFKSSIRDNILYGLDKSCYSMRDVIRAAKQANIHDFIQTLPLGYDTQVGEKGNQMSGGQKQRIAIARTLIRQPTVLILDEATSALDAESESLVNQALERAAKGKTCIKIAHRLSTVREADQIAVIEAGQIVELGSHDQLMAVGRRGIYYKLMQKQQISS